MKYIYTLLSLSVFFISCRQNQTEGKKISITSKNKGVIAPHGPQSITRNIIQDRKGNIWIAAFDGIFRFDGKSFTNITSKVTSARFFSVLEDRKDNLWFGSIGEGVYRYDGKSFENFTTNEGLLNNEVVTIYEDKKGNIWFGVPGGASCYDNKSFRNYIIDGNTIKKDRTGKTFQNRQRNGIGTILEDKTGKFWFGTNGDAFVCDSGLADGQEKKFTVLKNKDGKAFSNVHSIIEDRKGTIWFGASVIEDKKGDTLFVSNGLWRYDGSNFTKVTKRFVGSIIEDKKGNIWISSGKSNALGWTLSRYDEKSLFNKKPTVTTIVNESMLFGVLEALDGSIWFGSMHGVLRYDGKITTAFNNKPTQQ